MKALLNSLTDNEKALIWETEPAQLAMLDEDGIAELHTRIRRARNKYVKNYRRGAAARVTEIGARGQARPKNRRNLEKAEVFEDALARVSRSLAAAAKRSADELKAERIAAVRAERNTMPPPVPQRPRKTPVASQRPRRTPSSAPGMKKRQASSQGAGARRQARRDSKTA